MRFEQRDQGGVAARPRVDEIFARAGGFEPCGDFGDFSVARGADGRESDRAVEQAERQSRRDQQRCVGDMLDLGTSLRGSRRVHVDEGCEFDPVSLPRKFAIVGAAHH